MKRRILAVILTLQVLLCGCGSAVAWDASAEASLTAYENGEVLVGYADGSFAVLTFQTQEELAVGLEQLAEDETVILYQPNYSYQTTSVSDRLYGQQWALNNDGSFKMEESKNRHPVYETPFASPVAPGQWVRPEAYRSAAHSAPASQPVSAVAGIDIHAEEAWAVYNGGSRDVIVAVIDTGIDYTHEDLQGAMWVNPGEIADNYIDDDGNGYIDDIYGWNFYNNNNRVYMSKTDDAHGTHGAGTIAASTDNGIGIAGIADSDRVKIMSLKALGGYNGSGSTASVIRAIRYAEANGASICNLSLGSSVNDPALYRVMANSSMLFVVAAGNDGMNTDQSPCYPASYELDNILSVANLNYEGTLHSSSNYGALSVDIAAPGSYILSTTPRDGYSYMTGTSMAAPMVTAAAAMLYSHYDSMTLADVKTALLDSAGALDALSGKVLTGGVLNLGAAMNRDAEASYGREWEVPVTAGIAPEITVQVINQWGVTYLYVQVSDDDLMLTAYAPGTRTAQEFEQGTAGIVFRTDKEGTAVFSASSAGTYTFYALDAGGNETVQTVTIQVRTPGPMQTLPSVPGGGWGFGWPGQHGFGW